MQLDSEFKYLFKVQTGKAYDEVKDAEINDTSIVPGFNTKRSILILRGPNAAPKNKTYFGYDLIPCFDKQKFKDYPEIMKLAARIVEKAGYTQVGMITLAVMYPGSTVQPHIDNGPYYAHYHRLHVALTSVTGSVLKSGDVELSIKAGEVWELNNLLVHSARNEGTAPRYHLIIDTV